jgi:hypothetical protein
VAVIAGQAGGGAPLADFGVCRDAASPGSKAIGLMKHTGI